MPKPRIYDYDQIRRMHADGYSKRRIAFLVGCSWYTVHKAVTGRGPYRSQLEYERRRLADLIRKHRQKIREIDAQIISLGKSGEE